MKVRFFCAFFALVFVVLAGASAQAQSGGLDPSFAACERAVDEEALRQAVAANARTVMSAAAEAIRHEDIVRQSWNQVNFDGKFARIVDAKIALMRQDRSYIERLLDGNIPSRAEEMATKTAETIFNSPEFKTLQEELQASIAAKLEKEVTGAQLDAQSSAAECLSAFLRNRYAETVSSAYASHTASVAIGAGFDSGGAGFQATVSMAAIIAGLLAVVFRRLVRRIIAAVIRRLAGAIAARLASMASIVLGVAVILYELIAGANGVFPIIREELLSNETRLEFQNTLIEELSAITPQTLDEQAQAIAGKMVDDWRQYKLDRRAVFQIADNDPRFKAFLQELDPERFEALVVVINSIRADGGQDGVLRAFETGVLERAVAIPNITRHIERFAPLGVGVADLVAWRSAAGEQFELALQADLPLHVKPGELRPEELRDILSIGEAEAIRRVAAMNEYSRREALSLNRDQLLALAARFNGAELSGLFDSLRPASTDAARAIYLRRILDNPRLISRLDGAGESVASSASPSAALDILMSSSSVWNPLAVVDQMQAVVDGRVAPMVMVHRYGWGLAIAIGTPLLIGLLILRWIGRLFGFGGRRGRRRA